MMTIKEWAAEYRLINEAELEDLSRGCLRNRSNAASALT